MFMKNVLPNFILNFLDGDWFLNLFVLSLDIEIYLGVTIFVIKTKFPNKKITNSNTFFNNWYE